MTSRRLLPALLVAGLCLPAPAAPAAPNELVNGSFEKGARSWAPLNSKTSVRRGGTHAAHHVRVVRKRGSSFGLSAPVRAVVLPARQRFAAQASVRAARGKRVCLRVQERMGARLIGSAKRCVRGNGTWRRPRSIRYVVRGRGSTLRVSVFARRSRSGNRFFVDHVVLRRVTSRPSAIHWGALVAGAQYGVADAPWNLRALDRFEENAGKRVSTLHFGQSFANTDGSESVFPTATMRRLRARGIIPLLTYSPQRSGQGVEQPDYQLADIVDGRHDGYLRRYAASVAAWGHPFFLRFAPEMNGTWNAWSEARNGNRAGEFVRAWRRVHGIFRRAGATNATWVWCPNTEYSGSVKPLARLYPGDAYVDWTCLDGYNWGTDPVKPDAWRSFAQIFRASYDRVTGAIAPSKPFMVGETASTEVGGSKGAWLRSALLTEVPRFRKLHAFVYFNMHADGVGWEIETSAAAQSGFARGIASGHYGAGR